jgi:hypothetical protein
VTTPLEAHVAVQHQFDAVLRRTLLDAAADAEKTILSLGSKGSFDKTRARMAKAQLQKQFLDLFGETEKITIAGQKAAAKSAALSERWMQKVLKEKYGAEIAGWDKALGYSAENGISALMARQAHYVPLAHSVYRAGAVASGAVGRVVNAGLVLQKSAAQIAKDVRQFVSPNTPGGAAYAAQRLARTEINNAFHAQQISSRKEEPWTQGFIWNLSGSHRVPDACNQYSEHSVKGNGQAGFWSVDDVPDKPHPNCFCFLTTATISEDSFLDMFSKGSFNAPIDRKIYSSGIGVPC